MAVFKCKMCGGNLTVEGTETVATCEFCGVTQSLPKTKDAAIQNLFNRANNLRLKCEFDKAASTYERIVEMDDTEAEAHWGLILCKYGIEYVEDPVTKNRIPTCHRTHYEALTADADYQAAIDYSDPKQQALYEAEARVIDRLQRDTLDIVKNEKPFDVFICYKETDENGERTKDSVIANDIYHLLTAEGFKVFYSAITLEDKLGQAYEPYIFAALNSAKVMLAIGSKPEYFSAVWVKNEWARFMQLMKTDGSKLLIPCFKDMDAYDLPEEFSHLQAQDMSKIGFMTDIVRGIKKVLATPKSEKKSQTVKTGEQNDKSFADFSAHLKTALDNGYYDTARDYCDKILSSDPENGEAHLAKLLISLNVRSIDELEKKHHKLDRDPLFQRAVVFADEETAERLKECARRNAEKRKSILKQSLKFSIRAVIIAGLLTLSICFYDSLEEFAGTLCVIATIIGVAIDAYISRVKLKVKTNKAIRIINYIGAPVLLFSLYLCSEFGYDYHGVFSHNVLYIILILALVSVFISFAVFMYKKQRIISLLSVCGGLILASCMVFLIYLSPIKYELLEDDTYAVDRIRNRTVREVVIPEEYNGKPVTWILPYAFSYCGNLENITIPEGVIGIDNGAFKGCDSLTSVTIPDSVISIGSEAFKWCDSLTSITIPNTVTSIGSEAFWWCDSLTSITIPDSVISIGSKAFAWCDSLTSITIPDSVTSIGEDAFYSCDRLTSVTIPDSVISIGSEAFAWCDNLKTINYCGTKAEWKEVFKSTSWDYSAGNYTVHCTDGDI